MPKATNPNKLSPWRSGGTQDFGKFTLGEIVEDLDELAVGDLLVIDNPRFDTHNLCRITQIADKGEQPDLMQKWGYALFVDPYNTGEPRMFGDREFGITYYDIAGGDLLVYRAVGDQAPPEKK